MKLFFLLSLSTGFAFLRYTLSIPSFLTPDANFTCNNLVKKFISSLYTIIRLLECKQPRKSRLSYGDTIEQLMDILYGQDPAQAGFLFLLIINFLYVIVKLSTPR